MTDESGEARESTVGASGRGDHGDRKSSTHVSVTARSDVWQQRASEHQLAQTSNPFSGAWAGPSYVKPHQNDDSYGRPKQGSKTEYRGKQAGVRISSEIVELCDIIQQLGTEQVDGTFAITFGDLFEFYTRISNKLVGMLMRARKQNLVTFEGEMLFQRRDDDKIIRLIQRPEMLMSEIEKQKEQLQKHQQAGNMKQ